jgi:phosphonate dehydrogenase
MTTPRAKVVVSHWVHPEILDELAQHCDLSANRTRDSLSRADLLARTRNARALLAFMPDRIDAEFLDACPTLGIVAGAFKGVDNVDVGACTERGIWVSAVPDLLTEPTAELALALLLSLSRRVREGDAVVRGGEFRYWRPVLYAGGVSGRTVGLVGMGAIGQAVASRLRGFSCRAIYFDPKPLPPAKEAELGLERAELAALLSASDQVVLALPLTPATRHLIDARALAGMKPGAGLVNVGRGSVVDERAVAAALRSGRLGGYAADVFECEDLSLPDRPPRIPEELLAHDLRTIFTPHLGSAVGDTRLAIARSAAGSILDFLRGQPPSNAVNRPQTAGIRRAPEAISRISSAE